MKKIRPWVKDDVRKPALDEWMQFAKDIDTSKIDPIFFDYCFAPHMIKPKSLILAAALLNRQESTDEDQPKKV